MLQADGELQPAAVLASFFAYAPTFTGGVNVAAGDVNGDGKADIITGAGRGGGPHVEVFNGVGLGLIASFYAYNPNFTGGVNVAAGDLNGDGHADIVTGAGAGGGPHVLAFNGAGLAAGGSAAMNAVANPLQSFFAFGAGFTGGVTVAVGDLTAVGTEDIITGAGAGGGPHVKAFDATTLNQVASFFAYAPTFFGGVDVAAAMYGGGTTSDIVTGPGQGTSPSINVFNTTASTAVAGFIAFDQVFMGGVFVG